VTGTRKVGWVRAGPGTSAKLPQLASVKDTIVSIKLPASLHVVCYRREFHGLVSAVLRYGIHTHFRTCWVQIAGTNMFHLILHPPYSKQAEITDQLSINVRDITPTIIKTKIEMLRFGPS